MKTLHTTLALSLIILAASSSLAAETPLGTAPITPTPAAVPAPGSPEAAAQNLEHRLIGTSWSFAPKKNWVRFEKNGHLYVGWAKSAFGKWKVTGDHLVEFSPWTDGHKEILNLHSSLRTGTITSADGTVSKTERTGK